MVSPKSLLNPASKWGKSFGQKILLYVAFASLYNSLQQVDRG
jgi:hypothetical protein